MFTALIHFNVADDGPYSRAEVIEAIERALIIDFEDGESHCLISAEVDVESTLEHEQVGDVILHKVFAYPFSGVTYADCDESWRLRQV